MWDNKNSLWLYVINHETFSKVKHQWKCKFRRENYIHDIKHTVMRECMFATIVFFQFPEKNSTHKKIEILSHTYFSHLFIEKIEGKLE